jgi:soluble lytic murein transglycosylase
MGYRRLHFCVATSRLPFPNRRKGRIALHGGLDHEPAGGLRPRPRLRALIFLLAVAFVAVFAVDCYAASKPKHVLALTSRSKLNGPGPKRILALVPRSRRTELCVSGPVATPFSMPPDALALASMNAMSADLPAIKQAIDFVQKRKIRQATEIEKQLRDPMAKKLIEWAILRSEESGAGFQRYSAFLRDNPDWPTLGLLRRRAEGALWQEGRDAATVRRFINGEPTSSLGRLALARVLLNEGNRSTAEREVRAIWRSDELSTKLEAEVLAAFPGFLARADHIGRLDRRIGAKDFATAMRAAARLGSPYSAIVKACAAVMTKDSNARALLEKVPAEVRDDLGFTLCRIHWLIRNNGVAEAFRLMVSAPREPMAAQDTDQWWRERRALARELLDTGDSEKAYQIVSDAAPPADEYYRAERQFTAGWIALRFLNDPVTAMKHFSQVDEGATNPIVLARGGYWRGRAAEAAGRLEEARANYEAASQHSTAYYGQLARAKLGLGNVVLRRPLPPGGARLREILALDVVRAAETLYSIDERDLAVRFVTALAQSGREAEPLVGIAEVAARHDDAQAMLLVGKTALARGFAFDLYAFPTIGVPRYTTVGPETETSIVFSVARTESGFDPHDASPAQAVGLLQVTPEAGRDTASRFRVPYDWNRLVCDPVYNTQMGAAELAGLLQDYRGSLLLVFAGYNAGRGRVDKWIAQYGDPRSPKTDPIDWVERIPFAETRNYVERVMENLHVYRKLFADRSARALTHASEFVEQTSP